MTELESIWKIPPPELGIIRYLLGTSSRAAVFDRDSNGTSPEHGSTALRYASPLGFTD
jgi:hypothetical protein